MEDFRLRIMIEQFFDAVLTAEEERELCRYLRENDVPAELRKDKEAILAFCRESQEVELPEGAALRLEAMIDGLAADSRQVANDEKGVTRTHRRTIAIPRVMRYSTAAAVVIATLLTAGYWQPATQQSDEILAFDTEKDTFDNPEDAMRCLEAAFKEISLAVNSTQNNIKEIESMLGASIKMSKDKNNI